MHGNMKRWVQTKVDIVSSWWLGQTSGGRAASWPGSQTRNHDSPLVTRPWVSTFSSLTPIRITSCHFKKMEVKPCRRPKIQCQEGPHHSKIFLMLTASFCLRCPSSWKTLFKKTSRPGVLWATLWVRVASEATSKHRAPTVWFACSSQEGRRRALRGMSHLSVFLCFCHLDCEPLQPWPQILRETNHCQAARFHEITHSRALWKTSRYNRVLCR